MNAASQPESYDPSREAKNPGDSEPTEATLQAIDERLEELSPYSNNIRYTRFYRVEPDAGESDFGYADVEARESIIDSAHNRVISLTVPFDDSEGLPDACHIDVGQSPAGELGIFYSGNFKGDLSDLLKDLLTIDGLHNGLDQVVMHVAQKAVDYESEHCEKPGPFSLDLTNDKFMELWDAIENDNNTLHIPTAYDYSYENGETSDMTRVHTHGFLPQENGERFPDNEVPFKTIAISVPEDFKFTRTIYEGELEESEYLEASVDSDDNLPELTAEDRTRHPYMVIPTGFGSPMESDTQTNAALPLNNEGGSREVPKMPAVGFKVIAAGARGSVTSTLTEFANTQEDGQRIADEMYRHELAYERANLELTESRAQHVIKTLDQIIAAERAK